MAIVSAVVEKNAPATKTQLDGTFSTVQCAVNVNAMNGSLIRDSNHYQQRWQSGIHRNLLVPKPCDAQKIRLDGRATQENGQLHFLLRCVANY